MHMPPLSPPPPPRIPSQAAPRDPDNFPFVVLGNKVDKEAERRVPKASAQQWTKSQGPTPLKYFETSAKSAHNVRRMFVELAQRVPRKDASAVATSTSLDNGQRKQGQGCVC